MHKKALANCINPVWEGRAHCASCAIRKATIFAGIPAERFEHLLRPIDQMHYPNGSILFHEHEVADYVYVLRKGLVKLENRTPEGQVRVVRLLCTGDAVGLEAVLDEGKRYDQTASALRDVEICRIPHESLRPLEAEYYRVTENIMRHWQRQLEAANQIILNFSTGKVRQRVARVLLLLARDARGQNLADIQMLSTDDIAALVGVTIESVSRALAEMKRENLLVKSAAHRFVYDWDGLMAVASHDADAD